jgi:Ni/Co efflux regulator RcnB
MLSILAKTLPFPGENMKSSKLFAAITFAIALSCSSSTFAQGNGNGHGKGHNKQHNDDRDDVNDYHYKHHEKEIRGWYVENESSLPPGLAKKDHLPPGLQKHLARNGQLPPGLQKKVYSCPPELERQLPPPPPECAHVLVGGNLVLLNRRTNVVVDILTF